jgi:radical SAM protein with 4Fe4S-binding SPASM domain
VSILYVSLNAVDASRRKEITGLDDYDSLSSVLDESIKLAKDSDMKIVVKGVAGKDMLEPNDNDMFLSRWGGPYNGNGGHGFLHLEGNWAGKTYPMRVKPRHFCARAFEQIMVLWDGRVSLCCFDGDGDVILGDLNTQTLQEVYNGGEALRYREAHAGGNRQTLKLCKDCSTI